MGKRALTVEEYFEAQWIAGELVKAHKAGAFTGAGDPVAGFLAVALRVFSGTLEVLPPAAGEGNSGCARGGVQ
jgi:hypothetical protein